MTFAFTEEQDELRRIVRRFLDDSCPIAAVRRLMTDPVGHDSEMWGILSGQMGLPALSVPEEFGGAGYGFLELAVVLEEWGRALAPGPFLASGVLAPATLLASGDEPAQHRLLPAIASGERVATVALAQSIGKSPALPGVRASTDGVAVLTGSADLVLDGQLADLILVPAKAGEDLTLFAVQGDAAGLKRAPQTMLDQTRRFAVLEFTGTPAEQIGATGDAGSVLGRVMDIAAVSLAVEMVGAAERCLEITVDYAKTRVQFGRPIGSFQAIQHRCAEMLLRLESARSAAYYACWTVDNEPDQLPLYASLAKSFASEALAFITGETIQVHGGIGFTWEHDAHLYFKRAKSAEQLYGSPRAHRERLGALVGI